jgi:Uncharacterized protein conserved in bacteria (DUF2334)
MVFQRLLGPYGKMPILIRDDDTNFFTKSNMLESIYSMAWEKGLKISFGVIPLQKGTNDISVPPEVRAKNSLFPVTDNNALVKYMKDKLLSGRAEVLQHGLSHYVTEKGRGEFGQDLDTKESIDLGKNILTRAFDTSPKFFVPPGEDITKNNLRKLVECGLVPICRRTTFNSFLENPFVPNYIKRVATGYVTDKYKDIYKNEMITIQFLKPVIITVSRDLISWTVPLRPSRISSPESLFKFTNRVIQTCYSNRSPICIINHYHLFYYDWNSSISRTELFRCWTQLVKIFQSLEFGWLTTFSELYERSKQIQNIQIVQTGSKITVESKVHVRNFSMRTRYLLEPDNSILFDKDTRILTLEELTPNRKVTLYEKN